MIYATPFDRESLRATSPSQPVDFGSIAQVLTVMGEGWTTRSERLVIYGDVAFSDYPFRLAALTRAEAAEERKLDLSVVQDDDDLDELLGLGLGGGVSEAEEEIDIDDLV